MSSFEGAHEAEAQQTLSDHAPLPAPYWLTFRRKVNLMTAMFWSYFSQINSL